MSRIQGELPDDIRATILSMQSLMFAVLRAISQLTLGLIADRSGLPAAYFGLAGSLSILVLFLFWKSRYHFPEAEISALAQRQIARRAGGVSIRVLLFRPRRRPWPL